MSLVVLRKRLPVGVRRPVPIHLHDLVRGACLQKNWPVKPLTRPARRPPLIGALDVERPAPPDSDRSLDSLLLPSKSLQHLPALSWAAMSVFNWSPNNARSAFTSIAFRMPFRSWLDLVFAASASRKLCGSFFLGVSHILARAGKTSVRV